MNAKVGAVTTLIGGVGMLRQHLEINMMVWAITIIAVIQEPIGVDRLKIQFGAIPLIQMLKLRNVKNLLHAKIISKMHPKVIGLI